MPTPTPMPTTPTAQRRKRAPRQFYISIRSDGKTKGGEGKPPQEAGSPAAATKVPKPPGYVPVLTHTSIYIARREEEILTSRESRVQHAGRRPSAFCQAGADFSLSPLLLIFPPLTLAQKLGHWGLVVEAYVRRFSTPLQAVLIDTPASQTTPTASGFSRSAQSTKTGGPTTRTSRTGTKTTKQTGSRPPGDSILGFSECGSDVNRRSQRRESWR